MKKSGNMFKVALISIILGLLFGAIFIALLGKNPFASFYDLLQGCGITPKAKYAGSKSMLTDFSSFVDFWTPMIFAALAFAVALKAGLFNIGISGQMLIAAFISTVTIGYATIPATISKPLVIIIGIVAGALVGALIGFLKYKFNINEVVSSIMINYIGEYIISFCINSFCVDPVSRQSKEIEASSRLTFHQIVIGGYKYDIPLGFIIAIICVFLVKFLLDRTVFGYEIKAVGSNRTAASYAGINVGKSIISSMAISGALAGLAGVTYYLGYYGSIQPKTLPSTGFDAIAVCLLGSSNPYGILGASFLIQVIEKGSTYMSSQEGLESEIASVITAVILLSSACSALYLSIIKKHVEKKNSALISKKKGEAK